MNDEKQMNDLLKQFQTYFHLEEDEEKEEKEENRSEANTAEENKNQKILNGLKILVYSKIYEKEINSIFYFFGNFDKTNKKWNEKLPDKYQDISKKNLKELKESLIDLKEREIYDYTNKSNYIKFFTCLYGKKEAVDFLRMKNLNEIQLLYDKLYPKDTKLSMKDLLNTYNCVGFFNEIKNLNDNSEIFDYLKKAIDDQKLKEFKNFSDVYQSIIELNENFDLSASLYNKVNDIIIEATFKFGQDEEDFNYNHQDKVSNKN